MRGRGECPDPAARYPAGGLAQLARAPSPAPARSRTTILSPLQWRPPPDGGARRRAESKAIAVEFGASCTCCARPVSAPSQCSARSRPGPDGPPPSGSLRIVRSARFARGLPDRRLPQNSTESQVSRITDFYTFTPHFRCFMSRFLLLKNLERVLERLAGRSRRTACRSRRTSCTSARASSSLWARALGEPSIAAVRFCEPFPARIVDELERLAVIVERTRRISARSSQ